MTPKPKKVRMWMVGTPEDSPHWPKLQYVWDQTVADAWKRMGWIVVPGYFIPDPPKPKKRRKP